jgi:hypothetical protein
MDKMAEDITEWQGFVKTKLTSVSLQDGVFLGQLRDY